MILPLPQRSSKLTYEVIYPFLPFTPAINLWLFAEDGDLLKVILGRLTGRATFPNIILHGKTLGGSDDIQALHNGKRLKPVFEGEGVRVLGDPEQTTEE